MTRIDWKMYFKGPKEWYERASTWEKRTANKLMELTKGEFTYSFGPGAGTSEVFEDSIWDPAHAFDIELFYTDKLVAYVDVTSRNFEFGKYPNLFIRDYKVEALPQFPNIFFVCTFIGRILYYWTTRDKAKRYPKEERLTRTPVGERFQRNYQVGNEAWTPGLEGLAKQLLEIKGLK